MPEVWETRNYYDLLEVPRSASPDDIKSAFRLQSQAWAPDKMPAAFKEAATRRMAAINAANKTLTDPGARSRYDASLPPEDIDIDAFPQPLQNVPIIWKSMAAWMKDQDVGEPFQRKMAFTAGDLLERRKEPSEKQKPHMLAAWQLAVDEGFDPETAQ